MMILNSLREEGLSEAEPDVQKTLREWSEQNKVARLWDGDPTLWSGADEARWLGWLRVLEAHARLAQTLEPIAQRAKEDGFRHAAVMGMGGSSLFPDVLRRTFGSSPGWPELLILDSTVPSQVLSVENQIDPEHTLFIVPSKSGTTIEPNMFLRYFSERAKQALGSASAGQHFVAITDPDTELQRQAERDGFRYIAYGDPSIGGRFSALSAFGMLPAAVAGLDVVDFWGRAEMMSRACAADVPPEKNPGVRLGILLGTLAGRGRDKLSFVTSPAIRSLGPWLEQLIAESTGKQGLGLIPVDDESLAEPAVYGADRVFVQIAVDTDDTADQDAALVALEQAGHPVLRIRLENSLDLAQELFRWELATAVAGSVLGIHPFNQPDVEAAKVAARKLMSAYEQSGTLPEPEPRLESEGFKLYTPAAQASDAEGVVSMLGRCLGSLREGDYFAVNAFLEMNSENHVELQALRHAVRDARKVATTLGYGPRFLHSTGQLHKGGPNTGVFLHLTADDTEDIAIPGQAFSFGVLKQAQAQGDYAVLSERGRRILRVHLGEDVKPQLVRLCKQVKRALGR